MAATVDTPTSSSAEESKKPLYEASTQFSHWRFSPEHLKQTRQRLNAEAVAVIKRAFEADAASHLGKIQVVLSLRPV
jgi:cyclin H